MARRPYTGRILIVGGSGFLSGTLARRAVDQGYSVWTITRGRRPLPEGVVSLIADRRNPEVFEQVIAGVGARWDLVIDCIAYEPFEIRLDVAVFQGRARHLVFVSTDFVYDPAMRQLPQAEEAAYYALGGYGGSKRRCETELMYSDTDDMTWTIVRPTHIYGPGSELGCLPLHNRDPQLISRLRAGENLRLVGGGHFLQQPIIARDLADLILSFRGNENTYGQVFNAAGPNIIDSRSYYRIIAKVLGVGLTIEEIPVHDFRLNDPDGMPYLCHRIYDLSRLESTSAAMPSTPIEQGLREHVESFL